MQRLFVTKWAEITITQDEQERMQKEALVVNSYVLSQLFV
jgi:hypothetical protein